MNKGSLSLAIAVSTVLFTTLPSLADVVKTPVKPGVSVGEVNAIQIQVGGEGREGKGEGGAVPVRGPGPKPPRRDLEQLSRIGNVVTPAVNVQIQNIKTAPVAY